jgi:hypothetical protein
MAVMPPGLRMGRATPSEAETEFNWILAELERRARIAIPILIALGALFAWWGWKDGAYFGSIFYPPAMGVFALCALLFLMAPFTGSITGPVRLSVAGLGGLAVWTLLSVFWSSTPSTAVEDALRVFLYLGVFVAGFWTVHLLGRRMLLALAPVAVAGAFVAVAATFVLLTGEDYQTYLHPDSTLRLPLGYRNANAAFFIICAWPLLVLAAQSTLRWELRVLCVGFTTVLLDLVVLSQSRGSLPAAAFALLAYLAFSPHRLRAGVVAGLAVLPVLSVLPTLLDVFQHGEADSGSIEVLHDAGGAMVLSGLFSLILATLALRVVHPNLQLEREQVHRISRVAGALTATVVLLVLATFIADRGGPVEFLDQRVAEFEQGGDPDFSQEGQRFGANVGSNRRDFWRVALAEGGGSPLTGDGGGSFSVEYLRERESVETPEDPHSLELLLLSELGIVGLICFGVFVAGVGLGAARSWRLGPAAAAMVAGSAAAGVGWFVQASYDWFWHYPAVTATTMYLLGAAVGPALLGIEAKRRRGLRRVAAAAAAALVLISAPIYLSQRHTSRALDEWTVDTEAAYDDLERAADLNPLEAQPLLVEGAIATFRGDDERAIEAFYAAADREPDSYAAHIYLAQELLEVDPAAAARSLARATALNPTGVEIRRLSAALAAD